MASSEIRFVGCHFVIPCKKFGGREARDFIPIWEFFAIEITVFIFSFISARKFHGTTLALDRIGCIDVEGR